MILLNFSHPVTQEQQAQIEAIAGQPVLRTINAMPHFDERQPFEPQLAGDGFDLRLLFLIRSNLPRNSGRPNRSWSSFPL